MSIPSALYTWRQQWATWRAEMGDLDNYVGVRLDQTETQCADGGDDRVRKWLERHAGPLFGALGAFPQRGEFVKGDIWEARDTPDGAWLLAVPLVTSTLIPAAAEFGFPPVVTRWRDRYGIADLLAFDPAGVRQVASLTGCFGGVLGHFCMALGAEPRPLRVYRDPRDWLRNSLTVDPDAAEPVCFAWPDALDVTMILLSGAELHADDDDHAAELEKMVRKARKAATPPAARILVAVDDEAAAA